MSLRSSALPLVGAGLCLFGLTWVRPQLQERQESAGLVIQATDTRGLSSDVAVPTLALGAFRGLVVDYLWIRAIGMREEGRTYEARTLIEQICRLQPRLPGVWSYLASHLAYDLTATDSDPKRRWNWIMNGVRLLSEQGLRYNPDSAQLHYTLARIYSDKVNGLMDAHHKYFKSSYAHEAIRSGLGRYHPKDLVSAPPLKLLLSQDPEAARTWADIAGVAKAPDITELLFMTEILYAWLDKPGVQHTADVMESVDRMRELVDSPAGERIVRACAAEVVKVHLGMDPETMVRVDRDWGPLDWTSSFSAPVYWAALGIEAGQRSKDLPGELRCRRTAVLAVKGAMRQGRNRWLGSQLAQLPNIDLIPNLDRYYDEGVKSTRARMEAMTRDDTFEPSDFKAATSFENNQFEARKDFLVESVVLLAEYGRDVEGRLMLRKARELYPDEQVLQVSYDDFLLQTIADKVTDAGAMDTADSTTQGLLGLWKRAFQNLALGEEKRFQTYRRMAEAKEKRWRAYVARELEEDESAARRLLVPFTQIKRRALQQAAQVFARNKDTVGIAARLAERAGVPLKELLPPPPRRSAPRQPPGGRR